MLDTSMSKFMEVLKEELEEQLPDGYPCNVPKSLLIKDISEIVFATMRRWAIEYEEEDYEDGT